ncbi:MAG: hypothetical protein EBQ75_00865 [Actinobacteria bacterium]|nr:hypothetical protein [Actinomycetota bacterium]
MEFLDRGSEWFHFLVQRGEAHHVDAAVRLCGEDLRIAATGSAAETMSLAFIITATVRSGAMFKPERNSSVVNAVGPRYRSAPKRRKPISMTSTRARSMAST